MSSDHTSRAVERLLDVPADPDSVETASWILRGMSEAALFAVAQSHAIEPLDDAVGALGARGRRGDPKFAARLRELRTILGPLPSAYQSLGRDWSPQPRPGPPDTQKATAYCRLADLVDRSGPPPSGQAVSAADGHGRAALLDRDRWRPGAHPTAGVRFVRTDIDPSLAWRVWTRAADGVPVIVLVAEKLTPTVNDVWWGIHNGTHLDHISHLEATGHDATVIEYGHGLLAAESLAMSVELLAGLETSDSGVARVVWEGLVERLARLPVPDVASSPTAEAARNATDQEFTALPTLARAYTTGAVELLASGFHHPLIPVAYRTALVDRWNSLAARRPEVLDALEEASL